MHRLRSFLSALRPTRLGVLFAVLIGFGVGFWQWGQPPRPRVVLENLGEILHHSGFDPLFSPDGRTLATVHTTKEEDHSKRQIIVTLWEVSTGQKKYSDLLHRYRSVAFSPNNRDFAFARDGKIHVWDISSGQEIATFEPGVFERLIYSPEGKLLGYRFDRWCVGVWDYVAKKTKSLEFEGGEVIAGKDTILVVLADEKIAQVWDLATLTLCWEGPYSPNPEFPNFTKGWSRSIRLTPDRRFLMLLNPANGAVGIHDLVMGDKLEILGFEWAFAIAPDGRTVALGGRDPQRWFQHQRTLWNWFQEEWLGIQRNDSEFYVVLKDFPSGEEIVVLQNCSYPVFSPDGRTLAVIGADGESLHLWDLPIRKPIGKILGLAGLAAVATLLAFNGLGWLRRRRCLTTCSN
jgi:WD40 repeat protein